MIDLQLPMLMHDAETATYWWVNPRSPVFESKGAALMRAQLNLKIKENNNETHDR